MSDYAEGARPEDEASNEHIGIANHIDGPPE